MAFWLRRLWYAAKKTAPLFENGAAHRVKALSHGCKAGRACVRSQKEWSRTSATFLYVRAAASAQGFPAKERHKVGHHQPGKVVYKALHGEANPLRAQIFPPKKNTVRENKHTFVTGKQRRLCPGGSSGLLSHLAKSVPPQAHRASPRKDTTKSGTISPVKSYTKPYTVKQIPYGHRFSRRKKTQCGRTNTHS